jgi:hypothetical protein
MRQVLVRYRVKPEHVAENEARVRAVYDELERTGPTGFRYSTFKQDDGVSFVHLALVSEDGANPLAAVEAFQRFQEGIRDRCAEPPVVAELSTVGAYRFPGNDVIV